MTLAACTIWNNLAYVCIGMGVASLIILDSKGNRRW